MKSLYIKFAFTTIAIMLLSGVLAFLLSNFYYQQKLKPLNDEKNTKIALDMVSFIEEQEHIKLDSYLENIADVGYRMALVDAEGNETYFGAAFRDKGLPNQIKDNVLNGEIYHGMAEFPQETFVTGFFANELENTIGVPLTYEGEQYALFIRPDIKLLFNEMHYLLAWLLLFTIILSIILVLISTKYLVHPLSKITKATERLSKGNFNIKLDIERDDEIGQLAKSFTHMAKQLEALDDMKNEFISNISHDIKSPLSNIK
ncbi:MAG TPA: HAMP domain-containing protein, partial [Virgibacillus sp.]